MLETVARTGYCPYFDEINKPSRPSDFERCIGKDCRFWLKQNATHGKCDYPADHDREQHP